LLNGILLGTLTHYHRDKRWHLTNIVDIKYTKPSVADVASLPAAGNDIGDYRIVTDDGDGKAAGYMWLKYDGDAVAEWKKVADLDWGVDSVMQALYDQTQWIYYRKYGTTDHDPVTELPLAGTLAGQHIYGGDLSDQHLTLHANNGDLPGVHTGFIQFDDSVRPLLDLTYDLGTLTERFQNIYTGTITIGTGTLTITSDATSATISDTSGILDFTTNIIRTTGSAEIDLITIDSNTVVSSTGTVDFVADAITTTSSVTSTSLNAGIRRYYKRKCLAYF